jgi:hypothetical protein
MVLPLSSDWRWQVIRERTQMALGCGLAVLAVLILPCCGSWSTTTAKALQAAHLVAKQTSAIVEPAYREKCRAIGATCPKRPAECPALETCLLERRKIDAAITGIHVSVEALVKMLPLIEAARGGAK